MATILGPVQHTELCPASWVSGEGLNTNHIKVFFNSLGWLFTALYRAGSPHGPGPRLGSTVGRALASVLYGTPLVALPPEGEGNGQEPLPRPIRVGAATQESSTDITQPG